MTPMPNTARIALFLLAFATLHFSYEASRGSAFEHLVIHDLTVRPGVALLNGFTPLEQVRAEGARLAGQHGALTVLNGCEGTESLFLLWAALAVAPLTWQRRAFAAALGTALVFALNETRIVGLYYALAADRALFDALHSYVAPTLIVVTVGVFFVFVLDRAGSHAASRPR